MSCKTLEDLILRPEEPKIMELLQKNKQMLAQVDVIQTYSLDLTEIWDEQVDVYVPEGKPTPDEFRDYEINFVVMA